MPISVFSYQSKLPELLSRLIRSGRKKIPENAFLLSTQKLTRISWTHQRANVALHTSIQDQRSFLMSPKTLTKRTVTLLPCMAQERGKQIWLLRKPIMLVLQHQLQRWVSFHEGHHIIRGSWPVRKLLKKRLLE